MKIATEPIGSIPRPIELMNGMKAHASGQLDDRALDQLIEEAVKDTIKQFVATGSPVITDGEQRKSSFVTYPLSGSTQLDPNGVVIPFADGHVRQLPKITAGPFHYQRYADQYLLSAKMLTTLPVKQAVIAVSAMSLLYPQEGLSGYDRAQFIHDIINEAETDIRKSLAAGAYRVQIDFTEARLALALDPSGDLLTSFIEMHNAVLNRFNAEEKKKIGIHSCPGADQDVTHSADVPYAHLLPLLFQLNAETFYLEYAAEANKPAVLASIAANRKPGQTVFLGVTNVNSPIVETPEEICDMIIEAASVIPVSELGTTDDCGFSPFADDVSTAREIAFAKIRARVEGTKMAEAQLSKTSVLV